MIGAVVFETLQSLVIGRCYPNTFPQGRTPTWPAIRYTVTDSLPVQDVCGTDLGETDETRVQIDCVAITYGAADILRNQVLAAMQPIEPPCIREGMFETFDSETKTHRMVIEFTFHPSSGFNPLAGGGAAVGTIALTDAADVFAISGSAPTAGSMALSDAPDVFAISGPPAITGTIAFTDAPDVFAITGTPAVTGTVALADAADLFAMAGGAGATQTFTPVNANSNFNFGSASTIAVTVTGVHVGDLVVVWAGCEQSGVNPTVTGVSDGTTFFSARTSNFFDDSRSGRFFYLLSSVASGSVTYTATMSGTASAEFINAFVFTPSAAATFDTDRADSKSAIGSTSLASGNITTTGTNGLVIAGAFNNATGTYSAQQINGVNAAGIQSASILNAWYTLPSATFTGQATATIASSGPWFCNIIAFK